jgi:23S rRNA pseudouridine1911/1915/1917 synthase
MVVAKNNMTHRALATQIESRTLKRKYKALVWGMLRPQEGVINQPMARSKLDRKKMTTVKSGGKAAITHYKTLELFKSGLFSLVECKLETGRTHQIRVHLSHTGHSIVGDQTYGNNKRKIIGCPEFLRMELMKFNHQALHSFYISFIHPASGRVMEFEKELPIDYNQLIAFLKIS